MECIIHLADRFLQIRKDGKTASGFCSAPRSHFRKIAQTGVGNINHFRMRALPGFDGIVHIPELHGWQQVGQNSVEFALQPGGFAFEPLRF